MEISSYHWGFLAGVVVGVIILLIVCVVKKKKLGTCEFDERQQFARGKAYKYGFFTLLIYLFLYGVLHDITEYYFGKNLVGISLGICIGVTVFAVVSIWNNAYFSMQENPKRFVLLFALIGILNLGIGISHILHPDELVDYGYINLFIGVMTLVILAALGLRAQRNKQELQEEEG